MKEKRFYFIGLISVFVFLLVCYDRFITNSNNICIAPWGDGYKNFYTVAYYLKYNNGTHFTGMNYPYGENVIFTDNQPLLVWILKPVAKIFPVLTEHIHFLLVGIFVVSVLICFTVVYKTLREIDLPDWYSAAASFCVTLLSPQMVRLNGHFSLSYLFFFPLVILLTVKLFRRNFSWKYSVWLCVLLSCFVFIHPYYLAISSLFLGALCFLQFFTKENLKEKLWRAVKLLLPVASGFTAIKIYLALTDSVTDRPQVPWGFLDSRAQWQDLILHNYSILLPLFQKFSKTEIVFNFEGQAYLGIVTEILLLLLIALLLLRVFKNKFEPLSLPKEILFVLVSSIPVLLFSMAFPFCLKQFNPYIEKLPSFIQQFRAAGRFIWMFYYAGSITSVVLLFRIFTSIKNRIAASILLLIAFGIWCNDLVAVNRYAKHQLDTWDLPAEEKKESEQVLAELKKKGLSFEIFQAIIPLPYYHVGSEKIGMNSNSCFPSMKLSLGSGLPLAASMMSRTSLQQSCNLINLFSSPLIPKNILKDLKSEKPFLIMRPQEEPGRDDLQLLNKAEYLFNIQTYTGSIAFFSISVSAFSNEIQSVKDSFVMLPNEWHKHAGYSSATEVENVFVNHFDDRTSENTFYGNGTLFSKTDDETIFNNTLPFAKDSTDYEMSLWVYIDRRVAGMPVIYFREVDENETEVFKTDYSSSWSFENYKGWVRAKIDFLLYNSRNKIYISVQGKYKTLDELVIRPKNVNVISKAESDSVFMSNNYLIE